MTKLPSIRHAKRNTFMQTRFEPKLFYPKKCVNWQKSEFTTKQKSIFESKYGGGVIKRRLQHINIGNTYVSNF